MACVRLNGLVLLIITMFAFSRQMVPVASIVHHQVAIGMPSRRPYSVNIAVSGVYIPWWDREEEIVGWCVVGNIFLVVCASTFKNLITRSM